MSFVKELKKSPIAILGAGAVGKAVGADSVLAGNRVHLYELPEYAEISLNHVEKTGITIGGNQNNLYGFERRGKAKFDLVTTDIREAVKGAKLIIVAVPSIAHDRFFDELVPVFGGWHDCPYHSR